MRSAVLFDTSFLISLVGSKRPNHAVAAKYYRLMLDQNLIMYFSAIVAAEIAIKQSITDFPLRNFRSVPFNMPHAIEAAYASKRASSVVRHPLSRRRTTSRLDHSLLSNSGMPLLRSAYAAWKLGRCCQRCQ